MCGKHHYASSIYEDMLIHFQRFMGNVKKKKNENLNAVFLSFRETLWFSEFENNRSSMVRWLLRSMHLTYTSILGWIEVEDWIKKIRKTYFKDPFYKIYVRQRQQHINASIYKKLIAKLYLLSLINKKKANAGRHVLMR